MSWAVDIIAVCLHWIESMRYVAALKLIVSLFKYFFASKCYSTVRRLFLFNLALRHHVRIPLVPEPPSVWNLRPLEKFDIPAPKSVWKSDGRAPVWSPVVSLSTPTEGMKVEFQSRLLFAERQPDLRLTLDDGLGRSSKANKRWNRQWLSVAIRA